MSNIPRFIDKSMLAKLICTPEEEIDGLVAARELPPSKNGKWNWSRIDSFLTHGDGVGTSILHSSG